MKIITIAIVASINFQITLGVNASENAGTLNKLVEISSSEYKHKETLCELVAFNAHSVYSLATSESDVPKSSAERVFEMDSFPKDSLQYELNRIAIDDGYKKIQSEVTYKKIMANCTSKTLVQVENMHVGRQGALDDEAWQKNWDEKGCTKREDDMWEAKNANFEGESIATVKKFLKSLKNSELENRMLIVLQQEESQKKDDSFQELAYEFASYCGQGAKNQ